MKSNAIVSIHGKSCLEEFKMASYRHLHLVFEKLWGKPFQGKKTEFEKACYAMEQQAKNERWNDERYEKEASLLGEKFKLNR